MENFAKSIILALTEAAVNRMTFVTTLGILDEVPGQFGKWNQEMIGAYLPLYREAARIIEDSTIGYTILRPAWLTNDSDIDYEVTFKNQPFKGTEVSRRSITALAIEIAKNKSLYLRENIGVSKPNSDGDKPRFM